MSAAEARTHNDDSMTAGALVYPDGYYRLIEMGERPYDRLALCVAHQGRHVRYLGYCQALPPHDRSKRRYRAPRPAPAPVVRVELVNIDQLADALRGRGG